MFCLTLRGVATPSAVARSVSSIRGSSLMGLRVSAVALEAEYGTDDRGEAGDNDQRSEPEPQVAGAEVQPAPEQGRLGGRAGHGVT